MSAQRATGLPPPLAARRCADDPRGASGRDGRQAARVWSELLAPGRRTRLSLACRGGGLQRRRAGG
eukprot:15265913-Alexandrium_andersonii.AAC.1